MAIKFLHKQNIIHRDLKLQNLLLASYKVNGNSSSNSNNNNNNGKSKTKSHLVLKIGDFGLAARITEQEPDRRTMCGTPNYVAPEIANEQSHSFPADIFSCGVILFTLLIGKPPFQVTYLLDCKNIIFLL